MTSATAQLAGRACARLLLLLLASGRNSPNSISFNLAHNGPLQRVIPTQRIEIGFTQSALVYKNRERQ